jgi:hypothetical protein
MSDGREKMNKKNNKNVEKVGYKNGMNGKIN